MDIRGKKSRCLSSLMSSLFQEHCIGLFFCSLFVTSGTLYRSVLVQSVHDFRNTVSVCSCPVYSWLREHCIGLFLSSLFITSGTLYRSVLVQSIHDFRNTVSRCYCLVCWSVCSWLQEHCIALLLSSLFIGLFVTSGTLYRIVFV